MSAPDDALPLERALRVVARAVDDDAAFDAAVEGLKAECERLEPGAVQVLARAAGATLGDYVGLGRELVRLGREGWDLVRRIRGDGSAPTTPPGAGSPSPSSGPAPNRSG